MNILFIKKAGGYIRHRSFMEYVPLACLFLAGILMSIFALFIVGPLQHIGEGDAACYAGMARSLLEGDGLNVGYITSHFYRYGQLPRPQDQWMPLYSFLIVPFFVVLGKTAVAAKMPSVLISTVLLPVVTMLLTRICTRTRWVAAAAGVTLMVCPAIFFWGLHALSDLTTALFFTLALYFTLQGFVNPRWLLLMGVALGLAFYSKPVTVLALPVFWVCFAFTKKNWKEFVNPYFLSGALIAAGFVVVWAYRTYRCFGTPFHSSYMPAIACLDYGESHIYALHWGPSKPTFMNDKLTLGFPVVWSWFCVQWNAYWTSILVCEVRNLVKPGMHIIGWMKEYNLFVSGLPAACFGLPALGYLVMSCRHRKWIVLPAIYILFIGFMSLIVVYRVRYTLMFLPAVFALGWCMWERIAEWFESRIQLNKALILWVLFLTVVATSMAANIHNWRLGVRTGLYPYVDNSQRLKAAAWIESNTPRDAVIMSVEPWDLNYHAERFTVRTPYDSLENIYRVIKAYNITHLTSYDSKRIPHALYPFISREKNGLKAVYSAGKWNVYEIDYAAFKENL